MLLYNKFGVKRMKELSKRQNILLRNMELVECDALMESFISECERLALDGQPILKDTKVVQDKIREYVENYKLQCISFCQNSPKYTPPILDIIIGLPGSGKSKVIKNNKYMSESFKADADVIKLELATLLDVNINSPLLHDLSVEIRDIGLSIAIENKSNIVIEKVGKSEESINELLSIVGDDYLTNLRLIHCNPAISRIRNAMRFEKYNEQKNGVVARMIPDKFIKEVGTKPTEVFFSIVGDETKRKQFKICEAFIQETLYEGTQKVDLVDLYNEEIDFDARYEEIKRYIYHKVSDDRVANKLLCDIYSTETTVKTKRLIAIEDGDVSLLDSEIKKVKENRRGD